MTSNSLMNVNALSLEDREKVKDAIRKIDDSLTRVAAEKDFTKTVIDTLADDTGLDKKLIRKMAKTFHKATFKLDVDENNSFEEFYSVLFGEK
jgi:lysyl-tRNA synthetase class I